MTEFKYLTKWNHWTNAPVGEGRWLDEAEARALWEGRDEGFEVVPGSLVDGSPTPWALHVYTLDRTIRATFYLPGGPVSRIVDYTPEGGRLFKSGITDYRYAETDLETPRAKPVAVITSYFSPDGTGKLIMRDRIARDETMSEYTDVPVQDHFLPMPAFGEWTPVTDPKFGERAATVR